MVLKPGQLLVELKSLHCPSLNEVAKVLKDGLSKNFQNVNVGVVDCPDLTGKPFSLAAKGLCGSTTILEVGGVPNLVPLVNRSKIYDFKDVNQLTGVNPAFVIGAGVGPFEYAGVNCELIANCVTSDGQVHSLTQIAKLRDESKGDEFVTETLVNETTYSLFGCFYVSEGKPGEVLKIECKKRIGADDFPKAVRESLLKSFPGTAIGVGGVFIVSGSKVKTHIMPDFSKTPLSYHTIHKWMKYYEMNPPLTTVGTLVTNDPDLNLQDMHFHSFSDHHEAGHYHIDIDPDKVEYLAYFNLGDKVIRVDRPQNKRTVGHN